jgi:hypothetical protein
MYVCMLITILIYAIILSHLVARSFLEQVGKYFATISILAFIVLGSLDKMMGRLLSILSTSISGPRVDLRF